MQNENDAKSSESREDRYKRLHLCPFLTDNDVFHASGNGCWETFGSQVVLWFAEPRVEGKPNARTKKSERNNYIEQNAIDALLGIANIAERVAPYVWDEERNIYAPDRGTVTSGGAGSRTLVKEAGSFVDQFGVPHMCSDSTGPDRYKSMLESGSLYFTNTFDEDYKEMLSFRKYIFSQENAELTRELYAREIKRERYYVEGNKAETESNIYAGELKKYAKDFSGCRNIKLLREALCEKKNKLWTERAYLTRALKNNFISKIEKESLLKRYDEVDYELSNLRLDKETLLEGAEKAFFDFTEDQRRSLSQREGYVIPSIHGLYRLGLLFRDAIDLYSAIHGDKKAFRRVLTKCHMELFDVKHVFDDADELDEVAKKDLIEEIENRFTIWFESCGCDDTNPGSDMRGAEYETCVEDIRFSLRRKEEHWDNQEKYGCGCSVYYLCDVGEGSESFQSIARNTLQYFLNGLIEEGLNNNYKNQFAEPAGLDPANPTIIVNDFKSDLVRSLWRVMDCINRNIIPLEVQHCKHCGRLINIANSKGHDRRYCDATCRSEYRKRQSSYEKTGKEHPEVVLRRQYYEYIESGEAIHIGMSSHMGKEEEQKSEEEALVRESHSLFDFLKRQCVALKARGKQGGWSLE